MRAKDGGEVKHILGDTDGDLPEGEGPDEANDGDRGVPFPAFATKETPEPAVAVKTAKESGDDYEGEAEADGVDEEEHHTAVDGGCLGGEGEDGTEDGADTTRPADGEGEAEEVGAAEGGALGLGATVTALDTGEAFAQNAHDAEDDDEGTADEHDEELVVVEELAEGEGAGAEDGEGGGEAEHESASVGGDLTAAALEGEGEVGGEYRQCTGGDEAKKPANESENG